MFFDEFPPSADQLLGTALAEMAFGSPPPVIEALERTVRDARLGYTSRDAVETLAATTTEWLLREFGWRVPESSIRPVGDLVAGFRAVLAHFVPVDAPVIVPTPGYMPFLSLPQTMGRPVVEVPMLRRGQDWTYDFEAIETAFEQGARMLVLCNPHNPIGKVANEQELARIEGIVESHAGLVFADEVHAPILMSDRTHIAYAGRNRISAGHTITATSASKAFNIPATKCGQLIFTNPEHLQYWAGIGRWYEHQASMLGIIATEAAFRSGRPWLNQVLAHTRGTIREASAALVGSPVKMLPPEATYLLWLDLRDSWLAHDPSTSPAQLLLEHANLVVTDGADCGASGKGYVRFNAALPREQVVEAMERLKRLSISSKVPSHT